MSDRRRISLARRGRDKATAGRSLEAGRRTGAETTMPRRQRPIAVPNVLRDQTMPNQLVGMRKAPAPARAARRGRPVRALAIVAAAAFALLLILIGRGG